jgi:small subunit ribosomal protein S15
MHSRKKGRSGSSKPPTKTAPPWVEASKEQAYALVEKLSREGKSAAQIGMAMRDGHGIPSFKSLAGKSLSQAMAEIGVAPKYPDDLIDLIRKAVDLRKHLSVHKQDKRNRMMLTRVESKIRRLVKYYRGKKLPFNWKYDPESAALLVK